MLLPPSLLVLLFPSCVVSLELVFPQLCSLPWSTRKAQRDLASGRGPFPGPWPAAPPACSAHKGAQVLTLCWREEKGLSAMPPQSLSCLLGPLPRRPPSQPFHVLFQAPGALMVGGKNSTRAPWPYTLCWVPWAPVLGPEGDRRVSPAHGGGAPLPELCSFTASFWGAPQARQWGEAL